MGQISNMHKPTELEERVLARWYRGDVSNAYHIGNKVRAKRRFYVVDGDYEGCTTQELEVAFRDQKAIAMKAGQPTASCRYLSEELIKRYKERAGLGHSRDPQPPGGGMAA